MPKSYNFTVWVCMYVCMVITYSRVWINRVSKVANPARRRRLPILLEEEGCQSCSWSAELGLIGVCLRPVLYPSDGELLDEGMHV